MRVITIHCTIGATNAGKTTVMKTLKDLPFPGAPFYCGTVEVGQMMRAKYLDPKSSFYDPDHFKGSAAPDHTETEAWQMMNDGIETCVKSGCRHIFVDGQPRRMSQLDKLVDEYIDRRNREFVIGPKVEDVSFRVRFLHIYAPENVRTERAKIRDTDPAKLKLSMQRMQSDVLTLYDIIAKMNVLHLTDMMRTVDTSLFEGAVEPAYVTALVSYLAKID